MVLDLPLNVTVNLVQTPACNYNGSFELMTGDDWSILEGDESSFYFEPSDRSVFIED